MSPRHRHRRRRGGAPARPTVLAALRVLPRLGAEIGFAVAGHPEGRCEVLPGDPGAIAFTARGQLRGLVLTPLGEDALRRLLGMPTASLRDPATDLAWELDRRLPGAHPPM